MLLSIMIPTIKDREESFQELYEELKRQIFLNDAADLVEIVWIQDNRDLSIGDKRNKLLAMTCGEYVVGIDDDDMPEHDYLKEVLKALESKPDCIGFKILYTTNGSNPRTCIHSMRYHEWSNKPDQTEFYRGVTQFNPIKRSIALQVKFDAIRFGEDRPWSEAITKLCKKEVFVDKYLLKYQYSNQVPHDIKYGIR